MKMLEYYKYILKNHGALVLINEISCDVFKYSLYITICLGIFLISKEIFLNITSSILLSSMIYFYIYKSKIIETCTDQLNYLKNRKNRI